MPNLPSIIPVSDKSSSKSGQCRPVPLQISSILASFSTGALFSFSLSDTGNLISFLSVSTIQILPFSYQAFSVLNISSATMYFIPLFFDQFNVFNNEFFRLFNITNFHSLRKIKFNWFDPEFCKTTCFSYNNMHGFLTFVRIEKENKTKFSKYFRHNK